MCSSLASREKIRACKAAGVRHYLLKPIDAELATQVFRSAVVRPRPATEPGAVHSTQGQDQP